MHGHATDLRGPGGTITHRELRNHSSEVLRRVAAGEVIEVTNHGRVAAVLVPPSRTPVERLVDAGKVRPAATDRTVDLRRLPRTRAGATTREILDDLRGDR